MKAKASKWVWGALLAFAMPLCAVADITYTRPTPDTLGGYRYDDLEPGLVIDALWLTPEYATGKITTLGGELLTTQAFTLELHSEPSYELFGWTVVAVPEEGIQIEFAIPVKRVILYVGSDTVDNLRRCRMDAYDVNGERRGGDSAAAPFGPVPDYPAPPEGAVPGTTDWQYMVYVVASNLEPPYGDGQKQPPCKYIRFFPDGSDVYLGLTQAVTTEYGE